MREVNRVLTTLEEISRCEIKNFDFWSDRARMNAVGYFESKGIYGREHPYTKLSKSGFLTNMRHRRERTYYA